MCIFNHSQRQLPTWPIIGGSYGAAALPRVLCSCFVALFDFSIFPGRPPLRSCLSSLPLKPGMLRVYGNDYCPLVVCQSLIWPSMLLLLAALLASPTEPNPSLLPSGLRRTQMLLYPLIGPVLISAACTLGVYGVGPRPRTLLSFRCVCCVDYRRRKVKETNKQTTTFSFFRPPSQSVHAGRLYGWRFLAARYLPTFERLFTRHCVYSEESRFINVLTRIIESILLGFASTE